MNKKIKKKYFRDFPEDAVVTEGAIQILSDGTVHFEIGVAFQFKNSNEYSAVVATSDLPISIYTDQTLGVEGISYICEHYLEIREVLSNRFREPTTDKEIDNLIFNVLEAIVDYYLVGSGKINLN